VSQAGRGPGAPRVYSGVGSSILVRRKSLTNSVTSPALVALACFAACSYPEFGFAPAAGGAAGTSGAGSGAGAAGGADSGGTTSGGTVSGGTLGMSGESGAGASGAAAGAGGEGGASGDGGSGGVPAVPQVCADYVFLPDSCTCHDYDDHAYFFCQAYRPFWGADTYCGYDGMQLIRVDSSQENGWLLATALTEGLEYYWIGGTSEVSPGVGTLSWRWVDETPFWQGTSTGMPVDGAYANWRPYSPTDPTVTAEPDKACAYYGQDGWDDTYCADTRRYVCEWY
jgi:hypothetical protein